MTADDSFHNGMFSNMSLIASFLKILYFKIYYKLEAIVRQLLFFKIYYLFASI